MEVDSSRPIAFGLGATRVISSCPFQNFYCSLCSPLGRFSVHHKPRASKVIKAWGSSPAHSSQSLLALSSTPEVYLAARRACAELSPVPLPLRMEPSAFLPSLLVVPALLLAPQAISSPHMGSASWVLGTTGQASWIWWPDLDIGSRLGHWTLQPPTLKQRQST